MNIILSQSSDDPIYMQIVNQIKAQILSGVLTSGQLLPSIRSLAKDLNISVITTKRAYDELEQEGYIVTVAGKGTYVADLGKEMLREANLKMVEDQIAEAVNAAKAMGLTLEELQEMLKLIYEG
jgi:GntR family transcriptional regulator